MTANTKAFPIRTDWRGLLRLDYRKFERLLEPTFLPQSRHGQLAPFKTKLKPTNHAERA